jgi:hypothetical protein
MNTRMFLLTVPLLLIGIPQAQGAEKLAAGVKSAITLTIQVDNNISKCNVEINIPDVGNIEQVVTEPDYRAVIEVTPLHEGPLNIQWKGKIKFQGFNTVFACPHAGSLDYMVVAPPPPPEIQQYFVNVPTTITLPVDMSGHSSGPNYIGYCNIEITIPEVGTLEKQLDMPHKFVANIDITPKKEGRLDIRWNGKDNIVGPGNTVHACPTSGSATYIVTAPSFCKSYGGELYSVVGHYKYETEKSFASECEEALAGNVGAQDDVGVKIHNLADAYKDMATNDNNPKYNSTMTDALLDKARFWYQKLIDLGYNYNRPGIVPAVDPKSAVAGIDKWLADREASKRQATAEAERMKDPVYRAAKERINRCQSDCYNEMVTRIRINPSDAAVYSQIEGICSSNCK